MTPKAFPNCYTSQSDPQFQQQTKSISELTTVMTRQCKQSLHGCMTQLEAC